MNGPGATFGIEVQAADLQGLQDAVEEKVAALINGGDFEAAVLHFEVREWTAEGYFANVTVVITKVQAAQP